MNGTNQTLGALAATQNHKVNNVKNSVDLKKVSDGVRVSDSSIVDSRGSAGLSSSPTTHTSQPSERIYRESSTRSPRYESSRRARPSQERRRPTNYRDVEHRLQHYPRSRYEGSRRGNEHHPRDRLEAERHGRDRRGPVQRPHYRREHRYDSPPASNWRSPMDRRGRRSYSESSGRSIDSHYYSRSRSRPRSRSSHRDTRQSRSRSRSYSSSSSASSSSVSSDDDEILADRDESTFSKDQRTVFVSQLVMRATEKDIRRYFRRAGCRVREVILLRDKRMRSHKGGAYVQLRRLQDVQKAILLSGKAPDFQRFPLLVKLSEAEKNYVTPAIPANTPASMIGESSPTTRLSERDGRAMKAKKVYVGGLDMSVTEEHLFALFSQFGHLENVSLEMNPGTQDHKGFALLVFKDPKVANLAIHTMANKVLAGRSLRTGWANQEPSTFGVELMASDEFPEDPEGRKQRALAVLDQLSGTVKSGDSGSLSDGIQPKRAANAEPLIPTSTVVDSPHLKGEPESNVLVYNMFDKDSETEEGWADDLKDEFIQECSKFGSILSVTVMSQEPGGKIFASFDSVDSATLCAQNLAGRWFDKRQLRVEFVGVARLPVGHLK